MPNAAQYRYPESLPWLQFLKHHLASLLEGVELVPANKKPGKDAIAEPEASQQLLQIVRRPDATVISKSLKERLLPSVFKEVVRMSLSIAIGSEQMALQLVARKSVDRLAAQFDLVLPHAYPDENLQRATVLAGGSMPEVQLELLKLLLFLMSNRLILDFRLDWWPLSEAQLDQARQFIIFCHLSGLTQPQSLRKLVYLSRRSLTIMAVVDALFAAAVYTEAAGVVSNLMRADCRLCPDKWTFKMRLDNPIPRVFKVFALGEGTLLEFAIMRRSEDLVRVFLDAGANLPTCGWKDWSLLAVAIYERFSGSMFHLLQLQSASLNGPGINALQAAILAGDLPLIAQLVLQGADLNYRYQVKDQFQTFYCSTYCLNILSHIDSVGCLGFAASFCSATVGNADTVQRNLSETFHEDQDKALDLCKEIYFKYRSRIDWSTDGMTADAMIIASARGYTKVIRFLYDNVSPNVNTPSGLLSPLYAAVTWRRVGAVRLLLRLGASPCPQALYTLPPCLYRHLDRHIETVEVAAPSLLQLAVALDSCELTELFVQGGANLDEACPVAFQENAYPRGRSLCWVAKLLNIPGWTFECQSLSPFQLAVALKRWNIGVVLLRYGATPRATDDDLLAAAAAGHLPLVEQLLSNRASPVGTTDHGVAVYRAALDNGHGQVAGCLAAAGYGPAGDFASVFRIPDVTFIEALVPPDLLKNPRRLNRDSEGRSYLENAVLSGSDEVIIKALALDVSAYDSGALCAEIDSMTRSGQETASPLLVELLRRRALLPDYTHIDSGLEHYALSIAASHRCPGIIATLLANPAPASTGPLAIVRAPPTSNNWSALGSGPNLGWLLQKEIRRFDSNKTLSCDMASPLLFAVVGRAREENTEALLNAGYKPDGFALMAAVRRKLSGGLIETLIESCVDINAECAVDFSEETPLCTAVKLGRTDLVAILLSHHADVNARRGPDRKTALHAAIEAQQWPLIDLLLNAGAEVNDPAGWTLKDSSTTVLQLAAHAGRVGIVQRLIARGADINARRPLDQYPGRTALEAAAECGRLDTVHLLLETGTDTEGYGRVQYLQATALAAQQGHGTVVEVLRSHREWTEEDIAIWNQMHDQSWRIHPLELSLAELVSELADKCFLPDPNTFIQVLNCSTTNPGVFDHEVAVLIKNYVAESIDGIHYERTRALEEASRYAIQAIRKWSVEMGRQLGCSNIWGVEHALIRNPPAEICDDCNGQMWYYLSCRSKDVMEEVLGVVAQALRLWSPSGSRAATTNDDIICRAENTVEPSLMDCVGVEEAPFEDLVMGHDDWEGTTMDWDEHDPRHLYDTPEQKEKDGGPADEDDEDGWETRRKEILADMRGEEEASFVPADCGW